MADSRNPPRPRVVLLTTPSLFGAELINRLTDESGIELVGVGFTARVYKNRGFASTALTFLRRTGWHYLGYSALTTNVSWSVLRASGRPTGLAQLRGAVRPLQDVNAPETLEWLRSLSPDFVVSFYFN